MPKIELIILHDGKFGTMSNILYSDKLVEISDQSILIRKYYFPFGSKRVDFADIENITAYKPTLFSGKYRYWGTGNFRTWYPPDVRSKRDRIFIIKLKKQWWQIGFTVKDSQTVLNLLKNQCPVIDMSGQA